MSYDPHDTICAIGTATGGAARGMVRISGPDAVAIVARLLESSDDSPLNHLREPTARTGSIRIDVDSSLRTLPCDLFLWPTNRSYTREPLAELHTLGSPPLLQAVLAGICRAGARLAEPGEFTLRAFLAGRIDLTQAEAVLGLIDAGGQAELDVALAQLAGGLASPLNELRENLLQLLAELEAGLDFVDEDIRFITAEEILRRLNSANSLLDGVARQMASRRSENSLQQVVLCGPPNVGKSSLFNALVKRCGCADAQKPPAAISALVSPQSGTTRDYLTATISLGDLRCELVDTAGVDKKRRWANEAATSVDAAARAHSAERRKRATVRAFCIAAPEFAAAESAPERNRLAGELDCDILVITKSDLAPHPILSEELIQDVSVVVTSSRTGEGLEEIFRAVRVLLTRDAATQGSRVVAATAERCGESIRLAANAVQRAAEIVRHGGGDELVAVDLRAALAELGKVVGAVYTDDLLDRIFRTFCIGK